MPPWRTLGGMSETATSSSTLFERVEPYTHWFIRIALASIFVYHGIDKMRNGTPPEGPLDAMFFGSAALFWMVALGELAAGLGIVAGGFHFGNAALVTRVSGAIILVIMIGAAQFHLAGAGGMGTHPWHFMQGGAEHQVFTGLRGRRAKAEELAVGAEGSGVQERAAPVAHRQGRAAGDVPGGQQAQLQLSQGEVSEERGDQRMGRPIADEGGGDV